MKKIILLALITLAVANGYSQKKGGFRVGLDFGYVPTGGGGGGMFSLEPKYNLADNMNVGLRLGAAGMAKDTRRIIQINQQLQKFQLIALLLELMIIIFINQEEVLLRLILEQE